MRQLTKPYLEGACDRLKSVLDDMPFTVDDRVKRSVIRSGILNEMHRVDLVDVPLSDMGRVVAAEMSILFDVSFDQWANKDFNRMIDSVATYCSGLNVPPEHFMFYLARLSASHASGTTRYLARLRSYRRHSRSLLAKAYFDQVMDYLSDLEPPTMDNKGRVKY